ncbi:ras-related protein Rap-2a-like [Alligator mississippiensis]|uniref:ras-related protein Rap-2a-like n=1 Tax=Alligator mississippiensis TaxID=8496 RepID=UPI0003D07DA5|nr:ras-related protein Rap-2a-like [Alligator mississippiensis]
MGPGAVQAETSVRLAVLGAAGVGKTALVRRLLRGSFEARHRRTVEELHVLELEPEPGRRLRLEILDTSGSYSFPAMRRLCLSRADAFVLVYSLQEPDSFGEVRRLRDELLAARRDAAPVLVVANKSDAEAEELAAEAGAALAAAVQRDWGWAHVRASARLGHGLRELLRELLRHAPPPSPKPAPRRAHRGPACALC